MDIRNVKGTISAQILINHWILRYFVLSDKAMCGSRARFEAARNVEDLFFKTHLDSSIKSGNLSGQKWDAVLFTKFLNNNSNMCVKQS